MTIDLYINEANDYAIWKIALNPLHYNSFFVNLHN